MAQKGHPLRYLAASLQTAADVPLQCVAPHDERYEQTFARVAEGELKPYGWISHHEDWNRSI